MTVDLALAVRTTEKCGAGLSEELSFIPGEPGKLNKLHLTKEMMIAFYF